MLIYGEGRCVVSIKVVYLQEIYITNNYNNCETDF